LRDAVLASQPQDWRAVVEGLFTPLPPGRAIHYQKHMTHHMLPLVGRAWIRRCRNAFLIRDPALVLSSYARRRSEVTLEDIGVVQQHEIFQQAADESGQLPAVIDSHDVLARPNAVLPQLCAALGIPYTPAMLSWPPGRRATDGVWAPAWYDAVEQSTG